MKAVRFYRLRFQIELVFRDAKQFAGLTHCQARSKEKLAFHMNMSLAAINPASLRILRSEKATSISNCVRQAYNRWLVGRLSSRLGPKARFGLNHPQVLQVICMGSITAWLKSHTQSRVHHCRIVVCSCRPKYARAAHATTIRYALSTLGQIWEECDFRFGADGVSETSPERNSSSAWAPRFRTS